jgi:hypothetical protein
MVFKAVTCLAVIAGKAAISTGDLVIFIPKLDSIPIQIKLVGRNIIVKEDSLNALKGSSGTPVSVGNCCEHYVNSICVYKYVLVLANITS